MYAVDDLSDAIDVTREFLTPVDAGTWLRLAIVVFFLTGLGFGMPTVPTGDVSLPEDDAVADEPFESPIPTEDLVALLAVVAIIVIALWLVFAFVGSMMEFVLVESLRSDDVRVRRYAGDNLGRAVSLFLFRLVLGVLAALVVAVPAYVLVSPLESIDEVSPSALGALALLGFATYLVYAVIMRLTTEFVVPVMLLEERGVRAGWGRFWLTLRGNLGEYVVYVLFASIIGFVASIAVGILATLTMLVLLIPFGLLAVVFFFLGPLAVPLLVLLVLAMVLTFLLVMALYEMPVVAYIRYYALLVLGDTDGELDLIPGRREAVRAGGGDFDGATGDRIDEPGREGRELDDDAGPNGDDDGWIGTDDDWSGTDAGWGDADGVASDGERDDEGADRSSADDDRGGWRYRDE
ncbi:hypothetical protein [Halovivax sp.]|uniref:DUF7544 domain-containing protein n=1 Tax=Halovivax sp. TaxID=1935978 RepID=UPI0025BDBA39|nr:hypothetical protein [Halovivax sp.]